MCGFPHELDLVGGHLFSHRRRAAVDIVELEHVWSDHGAQRVPPWHRSWSTRTFTNSLSNLVVVPVSDVVVVPLEVAAGIDTQLHTGDVTGFF